VNTGCKLDVPDSMKINGGIRGIITIINEVMLTFLLLCYGSKCGYHYKVQTFIKLNKIPSGDVSVQHNIKHD
jgi:hypothetical protein